MRVLVLGGAGFIGRHTTAALLARGASVHVVDIAPMPDLAAPSERLTSELGSVLDADLVARRVREADLVILLAALASPIDYGRRPMATMDVTLRGSLHVVDALRQHPVPLLFSSTSEIYGMNPELPWDEDAARVLGSVEDVRWCYSTAKAAVEHYLHACRRESGLEFTTARLFNVYGPGLRGRVVDGFIDLAERGAPIVLYGDGSQTRSFTYVDDAIDALMRIFDHGGFAGRTYNIGNPVETTIRDLAELVIRLTGSSSVVTSIPKKDVYAGYDDVPRRKPSIARIDADFGWAPSTSLEDGLRRTIAARRAARGEAA